MTAERVVITKMGSTDNIRISEFKIPEPAANEVLIKVEYSGLSYSDIMLRTSKIPGLPGLPATPGADCVGVVKKKGSNVTHIKKGQRVAAILMSSFGGQSQYVSVPADNLLPIPDDIPSDKALCMIINYMTAYMLMQKFKAKNNKTNPRVLIHGGAGGVGTALIQLAQAYNMEVLSTASTANIEFLTSLKVEVIDYTDTHFEDYIRTKYPDKLDAVFDPIAGSYIERSLKVLKKGGHYIAYGFQSAIKKQLWGVISTMFSFFTRKVVTPSRHMSLEMLINYTIDQQKEMLQQVFKLYREGKIDPVISGIYALSQALEAHSQLAKGKRRGKILLKMQA